MRGRPRLAAPASGRRSRIRNRCPPTGGGADFGSGSSVPRRRNDGGGGHRTSPRPIGSTCLRVSPLLERADRTRPRRPPVQRCKTTGARGLAFRARRGDPSPVGSRTIALCGSHIVPRDSCRPSPTWPQPVSVYADKKHAFGSPADDFALASTSSIGDKPAADVVGGRQEPPRGAFRETRRAATTEPIRWPGCPPDRGRRPCVASRSRCVSSRDPVRPRRDDAVFLSLTIMLYRWALASVDRRKIRRSYPQPFTPPRHARRRRLPAVRLRRPPARRPRARALRRAGYCPRERTRRHHPHGGPFGRRHVQRRARG